MFFDARRAGIPDEGDEHGDHGASAAAVTWLIASLPSPERIETGQVFAQRLLNWGPLLLYVALATVPYWLTTRTRLNQASMFLIGAGILGFVAWGYSIIARDDPARAEDLAGTLLPSYVIMILAWLTTVAQYSPRQMTAAWKQESHLHCPKRVTASDDRFTISDDLERLEYQWPAVLWTSESVKCVLLGVSAALFHIVPKTAFASPGEAEAFAAFIREKIDRRAIGFPVVAQA